MAVEQKDVHGIGLGISKIHIAQEIKPLRRNLSRVGREAVCDFKAVLIGLMLLVTAEGAADGIGNKEKNRNN